MDEELLHRTMEQVLTASLVEAFPQERMFERMAEKSVDSHAHKSVEEIVSVGLYFDVHKFQVKTKF